MKIDRVSYQKIYPTGINYVNQKIGYEASLDEGDSPTEAIKRLKELADAANLETNPSYAVAMEYNGNGQTGVNPLPDKVLAPKESAIQSHIKTINECKTLNNLKIFEKLVQNANNEELTAAWNNKWKTFQE